MSLTILNHELHKEDVLLNRVNHELGKGTLDRSMFAYLRDIRRIFPKPIRLKIEEGKGGAHSFYTEETVHTVIKFMRAYKAEDRTIVQVTETMRDLIEALRIKVEMYKPQIEQFHRVMKQASVSLTPFLLELEQFRKDEGLSFDNYLQNRMKEALQAYNSEASAEEIDDILDNLFAAYKARQELRIKAKAVQVIQASQKKG